MPAVHPLPIVPLAAALGRDGLPPRHPAPAGAGLRELNGTRLYVKTMGRGEPIVVVHGGPLLEHGYLLPHLAPLADTHRLIFFDQRLSGRSSVDVDPSEVRMDRFVADVEALARAERLERFHLMGHSWGGLIAMQYAVAHPESLRTLILLDSMPASAGLRRAEEALLVERMPPEDLARRRAILVSAPAGEPDARAWRDLYHASFRSRFHRPELMQRLEFYVAPDLGERRRRLGDVTRELEDYDLHAQLAAIETPVLLLYGADEPGATMSGPELDRYLRDSRLVVIADSGHFPFVERPAAFLAAVRSFLER